MNEKPLTVIEGQTFGPSDTAILDGHHFIRCIFDGCECMVRRRTARALKLDEG